MRDDETEEAISKRLDTFDAMTAPLVGFYKNEGNLLTVSATDSNVVVTDENDEHQSPPY